MRLDDYPKRDGKRVWLTQDEIDLLIDNSQSPVQEVAFSLGARGGLRREEIASVTPNDFDQAPDGFLRVWNDYAKRGKYRETPIPNELQTMVKTMAYDMEPDQPVVDVEPNSVYRWVKRAAQRCQAETNDKGWSYLDCHDLRRTWGGHLLWDCGLLPSVVMEFGGWEDWETFREHYMGEMSPAAADRERAKIDYISDVHAESDSDRPVFRPSVDGGRNYS